MPKLSYIKVRSTLMYGLVFVGVAGAPETAIAIDQHSADVVGECVWPNVVQVWGGNHCTGVVLAKNEFGQQFIITAAHCINYASYDNVQTGVLNKGIKFGEGNGGFTASVDLIGCHFNSATQTSPSYPNAPMWGGAGVDMVVCEIDPTGEYPDVPTVPIMSPEGALRDHLRWQMYYVHNSPPWAPKYKGSAYIYEGPDVTVVGTGVWNFTKDSYGPKRALDIMFTNQFDGADDSFSTTTLIKPTIARTIAGRSRATESTRVTRDLRSSTARRMGHGV